MPTPPAPDFDAVLQGIRSIGGPRMRIDVILAALPDDQRAKVLTALHNPDVSAARIGKALTKMGHKCSEGAVCNWRDAHAAA